MTREQLRTEKPRSSSPPGRAPLHPVLLTRGRFPHPRNSCALSSGTSSPPGKPLPWQRCKGRGGAGCSTQSYLIDSVLLDPITAAKPLGIVCMGKNEAIFIVFYTCCAPPTSQCGDPRSALAWSVCHPLGEYAEVAQSPCSGHRGQPCPARSARCCTLASPLPGRCAAEPVTPSECSGAASPAVKHPGVPGACGATV